MAPEARLRPAQSRGCSTFNLQALLDPLPVDRLRGFGGKLGEILRGGRPELGLPGYESAGAIRRAGTAAVARVLRGEWPHPGVPREGSNPRPALTRAAGQPLSARVRAARACRREGRGGVAARVRPGRRARRGEAPRQAGGQLQELRRSARRGARPARHQGDARGVGDGAGSKGRLVDPEGAAPPVAVALPRSDELDCSPPRPQVNELAGDVGARLEQEAEDNGRAPTQLVASLRFETDETGAIPHRSRPDRPDLLGRLGHPDLPDLPAGNQWTAARSRRGPLRYPHHGAAAVAKEGMALLLRLAVRPLL